MEFFKKQNKSRGLLSAWLFGFINLNFTVLHQGPKYNSTAEKRGLADASLGWLWKVSSLSWLCWRNLVRP